MRYRWLSALSFFTAVGVLLANFATPLELWHDMQIKHTWDAVPVGWEDLGHPPAGSRINLNIAVKPERESALIDAVSEVSNPRHLRYGAYLSKERVAELVRPHPDTLELISAWLVHHGIRSSSISTTHGGAWLTANDVLVSQANQLLGTSYRLYRNTKTNETIIRTVDYQLPAVLHEHIQTVAPTTYFPSTQETRQTPHRRYFEAAPAPPAPEKLVTALSSRDSRVWPGLLQWMYQTSGYVPSAIDRNRLAVIGFYNQFPSQNDLNGFTTLFAGRARAATFTVEQFNGGGNDPHHPGGHANTDVQYAATMAFPTPLVFYSIGGNSEWEPNGVPVAGDRYLRWFDHMLDFNNQNIPQTISISYGDPELALPREYAWALCTLFLQLGGRGVSVLAASGNHGVGAGHCEDAEGNFRFTPEFPSSCPWVTSVGGTTGDPEVAASFSGGGFSTLFPAPAYQRSEVGRFLLELRETDEDYFDYFNFSGRGYPDIAAQASDYQVVLNNVVVSARGTSCAVSAMAGIVSLLNDFRISENQPPLGFLNPWLYGRLRGGIHDITHGSNPGCDTDGFSATRGWDPVTGLGTLNFKALVKILERLQQAPVPS